MSGRSFPLSNRDEKTVKRCGRRFAANSAARRHVKNREKRGVENGFCYRAVAGVGSSAFWTISLFSPRLKLIFSRIDSVSCLFFLKSLNGNKLSWARSSGT